MTYLVTGGAGFIGSHLVERLLREGHPVRVLDNFSTGKRANIEPFRNRIELIEGDLVDPAACRRACQGVDVVLHHAALPSVPKSVADPVSSHRSNAEGTFNILLAARDAGVRRFVYAASSSAYGETPQLPKVETMPTRPLSPYAVDKLTGEMYCSAFAGCYGLETISLRYFNVFGPRQDPASQYAAAIPAFVCALLADRPPTVFGDGTQTRDFTYVENVVDANLLAARAPKTSGEVLNVASGQQTSVNALLSQINRVLGKNIQSNFVPRRPGDIMHSWADIRLAAEVIGFKPAVDLTEGLKRSIDWYRENLPINR